MRAGVTLQKDPVKHAIFRIIDPVLVADVFAADAEIHATHRHVPQLA